MAKQPTGTVTLLFTDIEGSTRLLQELGPDRFAEALELHNGLLRQAFGRHDGYEFSSEGDSFCVSFERADEAVAAAAEAQQALATTQWPDGREVRVRMGVHTGEPLVVPSNYVGLDVHKAARVMAAGHGGQVLVSEAARQMLDRVETVALGEHRLKDLLQPEPLHQLLIEGLPSTFPALKTLGSRPTNLPVQPTALIGRQRELAEITALLKDERVRLLTLTGPGGTGKTRLALQAAAELLDDFESGAFFVSLAPIQDPTLVLPAIAQTLALREVTGEEIATTVASYLADKQQLLVLDNFEQVVDASADVMSLLARCPELSILVTSRERLRTRGERQYHVPELELPADTSDLAAVEANEAVALFVERAAESAGAFSVTVENAGTLAAICRRLDGLPLAIELAAALIPVLPPAAILQRLDQRFALLSSGPRDLPARQQSLHATLEWSHELLTEDERSAFRGLGVFVGGASIEALESVCETSVDVLRGLADASLIRIVKGRVSMLETIREFAVELLEQSGEADDARRRHVDYFVRLAEDSEPELNDSTSPELLQHLAEERPNILAALRYGDPVDRVRLAGAFWRFWLIRGFVTEGRDLLEDALASGGGVDPLIRRKAIRGAAILANRQDDLDAAHAYAQEDVQIVTAAGDVEQAARAISNLGTITAAQGRLDEARQLYEQAARLASDAGLERISAAVINNLVELACQMRDYERAVQLSRDWIGLQRRSGDDQDLAIATLNRGEALFRLGRHDEALPHIHESIEASQRIGDVEGLAYCVDILGQLYADRGDWDVAVALLAAASALWTQIGVAGHANEQQLRREAIESVRRALGETAFASAWADGQRALLDSVVARALELTAP